MYGLGKVGDSHANLGKEKLEEKYDKKSEDYDYRYESWCSHSVEGKDEKRMDYEAVF